MMVFIGFKHQDSKPNVTIFSLRKCVLFTSNSRYCTTVAVKMDLNAKRRVKSRFRSLASKFRYFSACRLFQEEIFLRKL